MEQVVLSEGLALLLVGKLLLAGYAAQRLGDRLHVPRVTLLILLGIVCGPYALNVVPTSVADLFSYVSHFALAMVGFLLGAAFVSCKRTAVAHPAKGRGDRRRHRGRFVQCPVVNCPGCRRRASCDDGDCLGTMGRIRFSISRDCAWMADGLANRSASSRRTGDDGSGGIH
jgi:hypothetical protein